MSVRQLAKLAGISPGAVSLALRNSRKISEATRRRVRQLAKAHGYSLDGRITELMSRIRSSKLPRERACFGVISFYDHPRPWENSRHLKRMHQGMVARAEALGYRLEPFWLKEPGMSMRRLCSILDARGIEGLLCFGSPDIDEMFPSELDHYAVVSQGLSIRTSLHRVVSHVYNDMWRMLDRLHALGYRRPGLAIGHYEEVRSAHAYLSVYLGWSQAKHGAPFSMPVLSLKRVEEEPFVKWMREQRPDVVIFVHHYDALPAFSNILRRSGLRVPRDVGVAVISQIIEDTDFSGLQENQQLIGAWAVELLAGRILNQDFGIPEHPRIEMVERQWIPGKTLRRRQT